MMKEGVILKIKIDHVTNSSSESFGIVIIDTTATMVATGAASTMISVAKNAVFGDAEKIAKEVAEAAAKDAEFQSQAHIEGYTEAERILDEEIKSIDNEMAELKAQWEESNKTADQSDPGTAIINKQYEEYIEYLESQKQQKDYEKYVIEVNKAEKQAEIEAKDEWINQRQVDMIAIKEEQALLKATLSGYGKAGFDTKDIEFRIKQLAEREKELSKTLSENNASIDYVPRDRGEIGPGAEFKKIVDEYNAEKKQLEQQITKADALKKSELEAKMQKLNKEMEDAANSANNWDMLTSATEWIQYGADMAVEGLSHVTGPAGQQIKLAYKAGKNIAGGMGEGMADPKNAGKHLAKGFIGAATEVVKDKLGSENPFSSAIVNTANEAAQGALDAEIQGKDPYEGALKGGFKGAVDAATDLGLDKIKSKIPIPKGSSVDVHDYSLGKIYNNNPLTKGLTKTIIREGTGDKVKDKIKSTFVDSYGKATGYVDAKVGG